MKIFATFLVTLSSWCICAGADPVLAQSKPTPGTVALLAVPQSGADVRMLGAVLGDSDPVVRAVAARIAGLLGRKDLAVALQELLRGEQDVTAAVEQVRALLYLRGVEILPEARAAAARLGGPVGSTLAEWLARTQPEQFAAMLPDLLRDIPKADTAIFGSIAALAVRQTPAARDGVAVSFAGVASGRAWREFLSRLGLDVDALILKKGLASSTADVREATIWFVVTDPTVGRTIPLGDLKAAVNSTEAMPSADDTEWAAFGRELIARRFGKSDISQGAGAITRHAREHWADARALASAPELTAAERSALRGVMPDLASRPATGTGQATTAPADETQRLNRRIRTFPTIAPGVFGSLLAALGCTPPSTPAAFGAARISYQRDGRPAEIGVDTTTLTPSCAPFIKYLANLTVAPPDLPVVDGLTQWLFTSMDKDTIDCADAHADRSFSPGGIERVDSGRVKAPRKIRDVRPVYPESMRLARISGVVIMKATVTATGCVGSAEVLRSVELPLDLAAMKAVLSWRFDPVRLEGNAVPVVMTVTVNFILK
jgi:TonB family protein